MTTIIPNAQLEELGIRIHGADENVSPRGFKPVIVFSRFEVRSEDRKITASRVHGRNVDRVRQFWTKAEVNSGDWVILQPNGDITIMTDQEFLGLLSK